MRYNSHPPVNPLHWKANPIRGDILIWRQNQKRKQQPKNNSKERFRRERKGPPKASRRKRSAILLRKNIRTQQAPQATRGMTLNWPRKESAMRRTSAGELIATRAIPELVAITSVEKPGSHRAQFAQRKNKHAFRSARSREPVNCERNLANNAAKHRATNNCFLSGLQAQKKNAVRAASRPTPWRDSKKAQHLARLFSFA